MNLDYLKKSYRFTLINSLLGNIKDKIIVDINCGKSNILNNINDTYKYYIGNEPILQLIGKNDNVKNIIINNNDVKFVKNLKSTMSSLDINQIDILLVLNYNYLHLTKNVPEKAIGSLTQQEAIDNTLKKYKPFTVIIETSTVQDNKYAWKNTLINNKNYNLVNKLEINDLLFDDINSSRTAYKFTRII